MLENLSRKKFDIRTTIFYDLIKWDKFIMKCIKLFSELKKKTFAQWHHILTRILISMNRSNVLK